jgi:predicted ATPase/DNA-binding SARP family transcriptional activator
MGTTFVQLLGEPRARFAEGEVAFEASKRYQLLACLAYHGTWVARSRLTQLLWRDVPEETARRNLRQMLHKLLRAGWPPDLEVDAGRVRWPVATDVAEFRAALDRRDWAEALDRYQGPLMDGLDEAGEASFADWLNLERDRLAVGWRDATLARADELEAAGHHDDAAALIPPLLVHDSLDEEAVRTAMRLLAAAGRPAQALGTFEAFARRVADELGLEPSVATRELAAAVRAAEAAPAGVPPLLEAVPPGVGVTLPRPATSFVGRELELTELTNLLGQESCRLLTLTGAGGVGKSRLAVQAAHAEAGRYRHGAAFVPLDAVLDPDSVPSAIAEAVGVALHGSGPPLEQLARSLADTHLLLVLDNFEHLMAAAPELDALLARTSALKLLVSSRERLGLAAEWLLPLGGLDVAAAGTSADEALRSSAVALFVDRARRVRPGFSLGPREVDAVLEICRLVDGLPLAIEMAAVWVRVLPCSDIATEIRQNLDFLAGPNRRQAARHGSIRATFEHSWSLLAEPERVALRRLAVFLGGARREAAAFVAGAPLPVLASLVDKSLLRAAAPGRYDRHPLLYQFTVEKLEADPTEAARLRQRHSAYFLGLLASQRETKGRGWLHAIAEDEDNVLQAWRWALGARDHEALAAASEPLAAYFEMKGRFTEGAERLAEAAAELTGARPNDRRLRGWLLVRQAWLVHWRENRDAVSLARQGLRLLRPLRDDLGIAAALRVLGVVAWRRGDFRGAGRYLGEALTHAAAPAGVGLRATLLDALGMVSSALGDYTEATRRHSEALTINERIGQHAQAVHNLVNMASYTWRVDDPRAALALAERARDLAGETGFQQYLPFCLAETGWSLLALDQPREARALAQDAVGLAREHGDTFALTLSLLLTAEATARLDGAAAAAPAVREALTIAWGIQDLTLVLRALRVAGTVALHGDDPALGLELLEHARCHPSSPHWNVMDAETVLARDGQHVAPRVAAPAPEPSTDASIEAVVARLLAPVTLG